MALTLTGPITAAPKLPGGVTAGYSVAAAGVVKTGPSFLARLACQVAGSITLNDCATTGAAAISNQIITVTMTAGQVIPLSWPCLLGITASVVAGGGIFSLAFT
jgi:hypothetical protein